MKRLLIPVLAALALPTALEANWFSGDIVVKNNVGEKTIVKEKTVSIGDKYHMGLIKDDLSTRGEQLRNTSKERKIYIYGYQKDLEPEALKAEADWESVKYIFEKVDEGLIAFIEIWYIPIFQNINDIKEVKDRIRITCTNPELEYSIEDLLDFYYKQYTNIGKWYQSTYVKYKNLDDVSQKVCDKYARFK